MIEGEYITRLIYQGTADPGFPIHLLWGSIAFLGILTLLLFVTSLYARERHRRFDRELQERRDFFFPLVMEFLEGQRSRESFNDYFSGRAVDFIAFEEVVTELIEQIEGEEVDKLQYLLEIPVIAEYRLEQLRSSSEYERIKACNYITYAKLITREVTRQVEVNLESDNRILVFAAASALMSSRDLDVRQRALRTVAGRGGFSGMAVLEMLYKFHKPEGTRMEEEAAKLKEVLGSAEIGPRSLSYLVRGVAEIGYTPLADFLQEKLEEPRRRWQHPLVLAALIRALGDLYHGASSTGIRRYIYHPSSRVRTACVDALGNLPEEENLKALYNLLYDPEPKIRYRAVKQLLEGGDRGDELLKEARSYGLPVRQIEERIHA